jgi:hypothetical protein
MYQSDITWPVGLDSVEDMRRFFRIAFPQLHQLAVQRGVVPGEPPRLPTYCEIGPAAARIWAEQVRDGRYEAGWLTATPPQHHEQAVAHMLNHPGMSYEAAFDFVSQADPAPSVPAPPAPPQARPAPPQAPPAASSYGADPSWFNEPPLHQQALDLMLSTPGMTYASALDRVQQQAGIAPPAATWPPVPKQPVWLAGVAAGLPIARPEGDWLQVSPPRHHEAAVTHMLASPGKSYEVAFDEITQRITPPVPAAAGAPAAPTESGWMKVDPPRHHQAALDHMLAHPGMTYEDAYEFVSHGGH